MAKIPTPRVPVQTPMFEEDVDGSGELRKHLTRTWIIFFEKLWRGPAQKAGGGHRTLLLKDTTVGNDIADHVPVYVAGTAIRLIGVLRKAITANLTVRVNLSGAALITLTIPLATAVDTPLLTTTFSQTEFADLGVLTWDVTASDGQKDAAGVASYTLQWG